MASGDDDDILPVVRVDDLQEYARRHLPPNAWNYYSSGANDENLLRETRKAYARWLLRARVLRGARVPPDTTCHVVGGTVRSPICVAPTAMQRMAHPDGEIASCRAAAKLGACYTLSSWATTSLEDVAAAQATVDHSAVRWFQLYVYKDRSRTAGMIRRACASGYRALVLTVDAPLLGRRERDVRQPFRLPEPLQLANFSEMLGATAPTNQSALAAHVTDMIDSTLNWDDLHWLAAQSTIPLIIKGVLRADDAIMAARHPAVAAIVVSSHGGRQLDCGRATIDALPDVVSAVRGTGSDMDVYLDGGVRRGTDVLKALALGAKAVFVGRPVLWGLAYQGQQGVELALQMMNDELSLAMTLVGVSTLDDITPEHVEHNDAVRSSLAKRAYPTSRL
ncbi:hypothetical protein PBRA_006457 [Plasmodiophora brassicae]|uniref:FMN hydroxy acid dehydrogenase domain-containing protein n=1 Tax=Plasmodiophora brassicae TaxID=37360 RepID=A0A0G4ISK7_PLABS|nr:hypothetical protein PBRA_006457 [Plasmodiophora brassicae]